MCIGIPGKIVNLKNKKAKIKQEDHYHWTDTCLIEKKLRVGDWLISYQDVAVDKISSKQAKQILALIKGAE